MSNTKVVDCPVFRGDPNCECEMGFKPYCDVKKPCKITTIREIKEVK
jgi:hypothetical protein